MCTRPSGPTSIAWAMRSRSSCTCSRLERVASALLLVLAGALPVWAQSTPRSGGELVFVVPAEPPSYDAHREETFALVHPAAPHYSTLLRVDPTDRTATRIVGDLAESWTVAKDGRPYTFQLRPATPFPHPTHLPPPT